MLRFDFAYVNRIYDDRVGDQGPELLSQVERKAGATRPKLVIDPEPRVQPDAKQRRDALLDEQRVRKRQQCVNSIARWPTVASVEVEPKLVNFQQTRELPKIHPGGAPFVPKQHLSGRRAYGTIYTPRQFLQLTSELVTERAAQQRALISDFPFNDLTRNWQRRFHISCHAMLSDARVETPRNGSMCDRREPPTVREV